MTYKKYIERLKSQTASQPNKHQLEFAILICKKLYSDYQNFSKVENWGDPNLLLTAIGVCQNAAKDLVDTAEIKELLPKIEEITPDMDDFGNELGSYALNASAAVYETLEFIVDQDRTHIYNIATYYTDTIDFKIQEAQELTDLEIANHPQMLEAWHFVLDQTKNGA